MPYNIAVIDSFDTPNRMLRTIRRTERPRPTRYNNMGPKIPRNQDKRFPTGPDNFPQLNGYTEETQFLLLTTKPNPLLSVPHTSAAMKVDAAPSAQSFTVTDAVAQDREKGHEDRTKTVDDRFSRNQNIQALRLGSRQRLAYAASLCGTKYTDGSDVKRVRLYTSDSYAGFRHNRRYIWCPPGIVVANIGTGIEPETAVGCTCRDMVMRGATHARYGCKHMIAYNKAIENNTLNFEQSA